MARANGVQKAKRLNAARELLRREQLSEAASELARDYSISRRQAYRYLRHAQRLKGPVAAGDPKLVFTVKLPRTLIDRLRAYATAAGLTLSEIVSRAVQVFLNRGSKSG